MQGYLQYTLYINKEKIEYKAHRLVALLFIPNIDNLPCVNHKDGNKLNNKIENLEWCTIKYNNKHARDNNLNNISQSNIERWKNSETKIKIGNKISETMLKNGTHKGEKNPNFKYRIYHNDNIISRTDLAELLGISQSYCEVLIRKGAKQTIEKLIKNNIKIVNLKESQQTIERIV